MILNAFKKLKITKFNDIIIRDEITSRIMKHFSKTFKPTETQPKINVYTIEKKN